MSAPERIWLTVEGYDGDWTLAYPVQPSSDRSKAVEYVRAPEGVSGDAFASLTALLIQSFGFDCLYRDGNGEWVMETRHSDGSTFSLGLRAALRSSPLASGWAFAGRNQ